MRENIKLFNNLQSADGYYIDYKPFITTIKRSEVNLPDQNLHCRTKNKMLKLSGNEIKIVGGAPPNTILHLSDGTDIELTATTITSAMTSAYTSAITSVEIGRNVTEITYGVFRNCSELTSIMLPNDVIRSDSVFNGCSSLPTENNIRYSDTTYTCLVRIVNELEYNYTIGPDTEKIISYAFSGCQWMRNITIPNSVTYIGRCAFYCCYSLQNVTIGSSVTSIGNNAFFYCEKLASITIPDSVTSIGESLFQRCDSLSSITVDSGNTRYDSRDNCNAIIETSSNTLIAGCSTTVIPDSVTSIGNSAFTGNRRLNNLVIPNTITSIGNSAFQQCSGLTNVVIPDSVTSIGNRAFGWVSGLTSITLSSNIVEISEMLFNGSKDLNTINYNGTISQWTSLPKGNMWHSNMPATVVHCTDGDAPIGN